MQEYDDWLAVITDEHNIGCVPKFDSEDNIVNCIECSDVLCDNWDLYNDSDEDEEDDMDFSIEEAEVKPKWDDFTKELMAYELGTCCLDLFPKMETD